MKAKRDKCLEISDSRTSWSGGKETSVEVPAITSSNPNHIRFNMVSVWPAGLFLPVPVEYGGIVGLSERSGYLDYQKKKKKRDKWTRQTSSDGARKQLSRLLWSPLSISGSLQLILQRLQIFILPIESPNPMYR